MKKFINYSLISIISFIISIILLSINLTVSLNNNILTILGLGFCVLGIIFLNCNENNITKKRGFEMVKEDKRKSKFYCTPTRSTEYSAAYDFYCNDNYTVEPNEIIKIWTDVKAYMQNDEVLILNVRSSMGGKFMLANTQGQVDSDYYSNPDNDGKIGIFLKNISDKTLTLNKGDRIAQGMFLKYYTCDKKDDIVINKERKSGFGSTGR